MQEYAPVPGEKAFTQARECYGELEECPFTGAGP
jgi:hypothetical protein